MVVRQGSIQHRNADYLPVVASRGANVNLHQATRLAREGKGGWVLGVEDESAVLGNFYGLGLTAVRSQLQGDLLSAYAIVDDGSEQVVAAAIGDDYEVAKLDRFVALSLVEDDVGADAVAWSVGLKGLGVWVEAAASHREQNTSGKSDSGELTNYQFSSRDTRK